jgi:hypothetical protein
MALDIQLEGSIKFSVIDDTGIPDTVSLTEFGAEITSLVINRTRETVARPPTFANAASEQRAGAKADSVTINFFGDETTAADFWNMAWEATELAPCELYFEATWKLGPVSATNPKFTGIVMVTDLELGGTVNEYKQQSKTWPARSVTRSIATV